MTHMPTAIMKLHGQVSSEPAADTPGPTRQVLRMRVQDLECALELELVERVLPLVELQQVPGGPDHLAGLMDYGGESVAVVDLGLWLGMRDVEPYRLDTPIVLCSDGQVRVGFIVSSVAKVEVSRRWKRSRQTPSMWVLIVDGQRQLAPAEIQAIAKVRPNPAYRMLVFERGRRRHPRLVNDTIVKVDGNGLTQETIYKAVAIAAGRLPVEELEDPPEAPTSFTPLSRSTALRQHRLVLVAEDNSTNQKVLLSQLALLGLAADVAADVQEALERWRSGDYALLLTDLHMPKLDGYALAQTIRAEETGTRRLPILALTANTLKGEADRCRAAGMDGYLSKPLRLKELHAALEQWLPAEVETAPVALDIAVLKSLVGDDPAVIEELLRDFRQSAVRLGDELQAAQAAGQLAQVGGLAHQLKSSSRAVGALVLGELSAEIEAAGKAERSEAVAALMPRFVTALAAVLKDLDARLNPGL